jgi:hypothetical protein
VDGVVGVCVVSLGGEANRMHGVVCWVAMLRGGARWREIAKRCCFRLLILMIPKENDMLSIVD